MKFPLSHSGDRIIFTSFVTETFLKHRVDVHVYVDTNDSAIFVFDSILPLDDPAAKVAECFSAASSRL